MGMMKKNKEWKSISKEEGNDEEESRMWKMKKRRKNEEALGK